MSGDIKEKNKVREMILRSKKVKWLANSEEDKEYITTTWFRCMGGEKFVKQIEEKYKIVGITFEDNNIGFILDEKKLDEN